MSMDRIRRDLGLVRTTLAVHVVDTAVGGPAVGLHLAATEPGGETRRGRTDVEGRARIDADLPAGTHIIVFETGPWYAAQQRETAYPSVELHVALTQGRPHQVELALGPYGYTTYCSTGVTGAGPSS